MWRLEAEQMAADALAEATPPENEKVTAVGSGGEQA